MTRLGCHRWRYDEFMPSRSGLFPDAERARITRAVIRTLRNLRRLGFGPTEAQRLACGLR